MKVSTILIALIALFFVGCNNKASKGDLSGTYTNQSKSEYSTASDTLIITTMSESTNAYQIERKTGFQKIRNNITQLKLYRNEKWQATWDADKQILSETDLGRQISFDKDKHTLTLKNTQYQKTN
jgi:YD repeat-containing protein